MTTKSYDPENDRLPLGTKINPAYVKPEDTRLPLGTKISHIPAHDDVAGETEKDEERLPIGTKLHDLIKNKILKHFNK